jgi:predicted Ser/Thr protein kinase
MPLNEQTVPVVISMEVDDENEEESEYRLRIGDRVKYLKVAPRTFDRDILSFPLGALPPLPYDGNWTVAKIYRDLESGELRNAFSYQKLAGVQNKWHNAQINVLDLERISQLTGSTFEAKFKSGLDGGLSPTKTVIAKIARFEWEIPRIETETRAYQLLENSGLSPRFLGHIHEEGRIIGFLLEKLESGNASPEELKECQLALRKFHDLGYLHGDVNRYNFLILKDEVKLIDFEKFQENATTKVQAKEMESLKAELRDGSGRGAGFVFNGEEESKIQQLST